MKKTAFPIIAITILALSGCNFNNASSDSINNSSLESIESSGKPYDPSCGFVQGYCLYDLYKGIAFKNIEELEHRNIIFESTNSGGVTMYVGNKPTKLYAGNYLYAADVNCDGHLDLIFGSYYKEGFNGIYEVRNYLSIYDIENDKMLFNKDSSIKGYYYPYLENGQQMALGIDLENAAGNEKKDSTVKFRLNDDKEMEMERIPDSFWLEGITVLKYKDITDELATPSFDNYIGVQVNSFDTFEFQVSLDYKGSLSLNNIFNTDIVEIKGSQIKTCSFSRYEEGNLYYNISFKESASNETEITFKIANHEKALKLLIDDSLTSWSRNRHTLKDIMDYKARPIPKLENITSVIYEQYPYTSKKRIRGIESKYPVDILSLLDVYNTPIQYTNDYQNPNNSYEKVIFRDSRNSIPHDTFFKFDNGTYLYNGKYRYTANFTPNFVLENTYYWKFAKAKYGEAYSPTGTDRARSLSDIDKLQFYDYPEGTEKPLGEARYRMNVENQVVDIYDSHTVKVDGEWFVLKTNFFAELFK